MVIFMFFGTARRAGATVGEAPVQGNAAPLAVRSPMLDFRRNNLDRETSPYLLQHSGNPVHWQPWSQEVLTFAQAKNRPILLSVGYAACHWCHVMAHESFEDPATAAVMNELFVNIKVDREERPDIDTIYQTALALLGEHGGWPLTMFLTPAGQPFWGGTYFPPESRWGRPAFADVLRRVAQVYNTDPNAIAQNCDALMAALARLGERAETPAPQLTSATLDAVAERLARDIDPVHGGIAGAPKFPQFPVLELLWRSYLRTGNLQHRQAVELSLDHMSQGGIYDHLGGGYARYSTDVEWLAPHFEKMLYDNAQAIALLTLVWPTTRKALYAARVRETVGWLLRDMVADSGAFAATVDADSEGEEGKFYVWREAEIDALLGPRAAAFKAFYDVGPEGNWEGRIILNRLRHPESPGAEDEALLAECRAVLLAARDRRVRPAWDDKVLADWNGLMITALARAGFVFGESGWIAAAERAFAFVRDHMTADGRLHHSYRHGRARHAAMLDDYANMAQAALALHDVTGNGSYLSQAEQWVAILDQHYWDRAQGGYFLTADDAETLITRTRNCADQAVPAGNGIMLGVLAELWLRTTKTGYRDRADELITAFASDLTRNFLPMATFLNGFERLTAATQIVVIGDPADAGVAALVDSVREAAIPDRVLAVVPAGVKLPTGHPAEGKTPVDGRPAAYVCVGTSCSLPITEPAALRAALLRPRP